MSLLRNYCKVSFRDLLRNKTYSTVNLVGLTSGLTVALMILQYVLYETGFDQFHKDGQRIYRVVNDRFQNGKLVQHGTITYPTIGPTLHEDFPEIEAYTRMTISGRNYLAYNDELHMTEGFLIADRHFLNFFSFPVLFGDAERALNNPHEVVLTSQFAKRLIPADASLADLIGQTVMIYSSPAKITAILKDLPAQSHLQFDLLVSYKTFISMAGEGADNSWQWSDFYHYVKLVENTEVASLDIKLQEFGERYFKGGEVSGGEERFSLQPLWDAHLDNSQEYEIGLTIDGQIVWLMLAIACFILAVAWINYINLTSSRALQRAKETAIRKSIGAGRTQVATQFLVETVIFNGIALTFSVFLVILLQPFFNELTGLPLNISIIVSSDLWGLPFLLWFLLFFGAATILVSLYPAWLVAKFQAKDVAHGRYNLSGDLQWLRKALVIFQFAVAVVLINGAFAIADQVEFMVEKDLGLDISKTLVVYGPSMTDWDSTFIERTDRFKTEVSKIAGVSMATSSNRVAGNRMGRIFRVKSSVDPEARDLTVNFMQVDHSFDETFGIKIIAGRGLQAGDHDYDFQNIFNVVVNESAAMYLGVNSPREAIGMTVSFWNRDWTIVGVVNDFHQMSVHDKIEPIFMLPLYDTDNSFSIKLTGGSSESILAAIQAEYDRIFPGNYFDHYFLRDRYQQLYAPEMRLGQISNVFTGLSILMVVLGLYGLVTMTLDRKVKEIGIRKVLGASIQQILLLISVEFAWLLLAALIIGIPASLYGIGQWKEGFAYRAEAGWWIVIMASAIVVAVSLLPIMMQGGKIVANNPIESLRSE